MTATHTRQADATKQGWAGGLTAFAGVMLILVGLLDIFRGVMAIAEDDIFLTTRNYVFEFDLTGWGWVHLALGAVAVIVGIGLFQTATWARVANVTQLSFRHGPGRKSAPTESNICRKAISVPAK